MKRRKGRPSIGSKKTYTISVFEDKVFSLFAKEMGKKKSELVREWIFRFNTRNLVDKAMEMRKK